MNCKNCKHLIAKQNNKWVHNWYNGISNNSCARHNKNKDCGCINPEPKDMKTR